MHYCKRNISLFFSLLFLLVSNQSFSSTVWQKGMSYTPWWWSALSTTNSDSSIQVMASDSVEWVGLNEFWFQDDENSSVITGDPTKYSASTESIKYAIDQIHARGMKVMLKPNIDLRNGNWRAYINPSNAWFSSYSSFIQFWADLATEKSVDMLCIGCEYKNTQSWDSSWRMIAATARAHYSGPITYAANHDDYNTITWWDALDYIGIDAYFALTGTNTPTLSQLSSAWETKANAIQTWRNTNFPTLPVIFTEIGYQSADGCNQTPWNTTSGIADATEQNNCYEACFEVMTQRNWFYGMYWWQWDTDPNSGGPTTTTFTPQNKSTETTVRTWYSKNLSSVPVPLELSDFDTH